MTSSALTFFTGFSLGSYINFNVIQPPSLIKGSFFAYIRSNSTFDLLTQTLSIHGYQSPFTNVHLNIMRAGSIGTVFLYNLARPKVQEKVLPIHKTIVKVQRLAIALSILFLSPKMNYIARIGAISGIGSKILILRSTGKRKRILVAIEGLFFRLPFLLKPKGSCFIKTIIIFQWAVSNSSLLPTDNKTVISGA